MADLPNPGSDAALARGCICAVMDNAHGYGYKGDPNLFVIKAGCPVHAPGASDQRKNETDEKGT